MPGIAPVGRDTVIGKRDAGFALLEIGVYSRKQAIKSAIVKWGDKFSNRVSVENFHRVTSHGSEVGRGSPPSL